MLNKLPTRLQHRRGLLVKGQLLIVLSACFWAGRGTGPLLAQTETLYRTPPQNITDILDAEPTPLVSVDPQDQRLLLIHRTRMPGIEDLAQPMLRLGGLRFNPRTNGPVIRDGRIRAYTLVEIATGSHREIQYLPSGHLGRPLWSPDGNWIAFTHTSDSGVELWVAEVSRAQARRLTGPILNAVWGGPCNWTPDSASLLCKFIPADRGEVPALDETPDGPVVRESEGVRAQNRTYQDLLKSPRDARVWEHYMTSQLVFVRAENGSRNYIARPGIWDFASISPDARYVLTQKTVRPFSYLVPSRLFSKEVTVWDRESGQKVFEFAPLAVAEAVPIDGVRSGPRSYAWQPAEDATLVWVEALDEGDPKREVEHRDRILQLPAPFTVAPLELARIEHRFQSIRWAETGWALLSEYDRPSRWTRSWILEAPGRSEPRLLWDRSSQDDYSDPGQPLMKTTSTGFSVLRQTDDNLFLSGRGASPEGDLPFYDKLNLKTLQTERLFECEQGTYEKVIGVLNQPGSRILTRRESPREPPNYFLRDLTSRSVQALTAFPDTAPQLRGISKQLITYQRRDGVQLSGTLYLPADYREGHRLPLVLWAYPREYNTVDTAAQVRGTVNRFTMISGPSHLFLLTQGYAVLDGPAMPIIGEDGNDTFVEQLVMNAEAAIEAVVEMGVADHNRVGIGGHSYGAFMTANLLAHSDLFAAGIARSGAYNRTLTPFGFQNERRTFWEAPKVYFAMSPFMHADKVNEPILLIHGAMDDNSGTFPIQSERFYHALKGLGGTVRYVVLPLESHGYAARDSILHCLAEMVDWFDTHVKGARMSAGPTGP